MNGTEILTIRKFYRAAERVDVAVLSSSETNVAYRMTGQRTESLISLKMSFLDSSLITF